MKFLTVLCVSDLDFRKVYKSSLAVGLSGFLEHAVILCSTELNNNANSAKLILPLTLVQQVSLVDEVWYQITTVSAFSTDQKRI